MSKDPLLPDVFYVCMRVAPVRAQTPHRQAQTGQVQILILKILNVLLRLIFFFLDIEQNLKF
jgi:hypothetical protein